jgi:hypothetical protein
MSQLARRVFEAARQRGIEIWYVTPSENSYPIFLHKWGYVEKFEVIYLVKILRPGPLVASILKPRILGSIAGAAASALQQISRLRVSVLPDYEIRTIDRFGDEADELWQRSRKGYRVALVRDSDYMNWRYVDNPDPYKILEFRKKGYLRGILVLKHTIRRSLKVGDIVDYFCPFNDQETRRAMFLHGLDRLRREGCVIGESWVIDKSTMMTEMRQAGLRRERIRIKFLFSPDSPLTEFYDRDAWLLTQGDGNDI